MDYYSILGITRKAEDIVIRAAYKALMRAYHPDRVKGHEELVKRINEAYETLSDPIKKAEYDKFNSKNFDQSAFYDTESSFNLEEDINQDWALIVEYYPDLENARLELRQYSSKLSANFMLKIIESKNLNTYLEVAQSLKKDFLKDYFGSDKQVVDLAEKLLLSRERKPLLEINRLVKIFGDEIKYLEIIETLKNKYPEVKSILSEKSCNNNDIDSQLSELKKVGGNDCVEFPSNDTKHWNCVCGCKNLKSNRNCASCKRNRDFVLKYYDISNFPVS